MVFIADTKSVQGTSPGCEIGKEARHHRRHSILFRFVLMCQPNELCGKNFLWYHSFHLPELTAQPARESSHSLAIHCAVTAHPDRSRTWIAWGAKLEE
jgi:hypothetical protein